jgi:predicted membrane-bound spermidine synthase
MRLTVALIFFLSGASALIFESLWFRLVGLSLGNSVWSASLVLAAFMGGLAIGNVLVASRDARVLRPLRLYAGLEFAIGICGIAVVLLLPQFPGLLGPALGGLTDTPVLLNTARLFIAFGFLLIPAVAMGATLPVLAKALAREDTNFGSNIGWLYGWNTMGAMLGALSTELFLIPLLGILSTGLTALVFNLVAASIALRLSADIENAPLAPETPVDAGSVFGSRTRRYATVAFVSGCLMLALEVVWFRFLLLTQNGTGLIFAIMLALVLGGIALGGLVAGRLFRKNDCAYQWLRHVTAASAVLVVATYWGFDLFADHGDRGSTPMLAFIGYATFLMFPVAALSGVSFTMVNRAIKDDLGTSARTAGIATFYNTVGAMLGSLAGGFLLLPVLGMEKSFFVVAFLYGLTVFVVPRDATESRRSLLWQRGFVATAVMMLVAFPFGLMQKTYFVDEPAWLPNHHLVATREGVVETIRYYQREAFGEPKFYRLVTNGHSMSGTPIASKRYMKLYVYWPIALNPDTSSALLISYGVGQTAKALTDTRNLQSIDIVDISRDVLEMNSIVFPGDDNPLHDDRVNVHIEDGRFFLNSTKNHYDLITSEPPPPKLAGVVNLYSQEYFELIRTRLNPGGFVTYWLPVQQLEQMDTLAIIRAFCNAFEDCSLWSGAGLEWMLVGSNGATSRPGAAEFRAQWHEPVVAEEMMSLGIETPEQLGALFMADAKLLNELTSNVKPVMDNYPSRISPRLVNSVAYVQLYGQLMDEKARLERFRHSDLIKRLWPEELRDSSAPYFEYDRLIKNHFIGRSYASPNDPYNWAMIDHLLTDTTLTTLPLWMLGSDWDNQRIVSSLKDSHEYRAKFDLERARRYTAARDYVTALKHMEDYVRETGEVSLWASNFYLYLLARNGRAEESGPAIAQKRQLGRRDADRFIDWYLDRFPEASGTEYQSSR